MLQPRLNDPFNIAACVTEMCNLDCIHCYSDCNRPDRPKELTPDEWRSCLQDALDAGVMQVFFEGGEPLLRPDFLSLVEFTAKRALVYLRTNGTLITESIAERLRSIGAAAVCV